MRPSTAPVASPRPNLCYEYNGFTPPHPSGWKVGRQRLEQLDANDDLVIQRNQIYRKVRPRSGRIRNTLWDDRVNETKAPARTPAIRLQKAAGAV